MADKINELILKLYEHNGLPKNEIYLGLRENLKEKVPRSRVRKVLKGKQRYVSKDKKKKTFSNRVYIMKHELKLAPSFFEKQKKSLRENYILNGIMHTGMQPRPFKDDVRQKIANIIVTEES